MILLGFWICDVTARDLGEHDPPKIVWDEIVGYLLTMAFIPFSWLWLIVGFVLFRLFDIWKPWPFNFQIHIFIIYINWINKNVTNGFGVVADDLLAAVYAMLVLFLLLWCCG